MATATIKMVSLLHPTFILKGTLLMLFGHSKLVCQTVEIQECNICMYTIMGYPVCVGSYMHNLMLSIY